MSGEHFKIYHPGESEPVFQVVGVKKTVRHSLTVFDYVRAWWRDVDAVGRVEAIEQPTVAIRSDMIADGSVHARVKIT